MLHQRYKDIVFWDIAKATVPNYFLRRYLLNARPADGANHLHLGCGTKYLPGFLNIDGNPFHKIALGWMFETGFRFVRAPLTRSIQPICLSTSIRMNSSGFFRNVCACSRQAAASG